MNQFFIDLNIDQLDNGLRSDGSGLGFYTNATIEIAKENGRPKSQMEINLHDTGEFWNRFQTMVFENMLVIDSLDKKTNMLINIYGKDIFGIPEENKAEVSKRFTDILLAKIKNVLENA